MGVPVRKKCKTSIEDIVAFGKKMKIRGTHANFADGKKFRGHKL